MTIINWNNYNNTVGSNYSMKTLDKRMSHFLGKVERNGTRFHQATQEGAQFKI